MFRYGLLALTLSAAAFAQQTGGTFETAVPQPSTTSDRPLVSAPTLTLSNGFSPATITIPNTVVAEQPQTMIDNNLPQGEFANASTGSSSEKEAASGDFNFSAFSDLIVFKGIDSGMSLGEIARQFRKGNVQAHKTYTNEDIDRLTSEVPDTGIIYAKLANGQPIADRNRDGFSPMSGIANIPGVAGQEDSTQLANGGQNNPMNEGQSNATASNSDQGRDNGQNATTPSANNSQPANGNSANQQMPASDNPR